MRVIFYAIQEDHHKREQKEEQKEEQNEEQKEEREESRQNAERKEEQAVDDVIDLDADGELDIWLSKHLESKSEEKVSPREREIGVWVEIRLFISSTFIDTQGQLHRLYYDNVIICQT